MTETHREIERKLRVHALFRLPSLSASVPGVATAERQPTFTMRNTYFDTRDLRLFRWRVTLRKREGGPDEGWHLKLPVEGADGTTRDELRVPLGDVDAVPAELREIVTALVRDGQLIPVVTLRTERSPQLLRDDSGCVRAEVVDDTVSVLEGDRIVALFREIEVEAVPSPEGDLDTSLLGVVVDVLVEHGAVPGTASKAASALGPMSQAPPDVPPPTWPSPSEPAGDAVRAFMAMHVRRLLMQDMRMRRGLPDAVHQLRVAARRLRSGLQVFGPLVDSGWSETLRAELAWFAGELGLARDTEVLLERLDRAAEQLEDADAAHARSVVDPALLARVDAGETQALETLASDRYLALLSSLVEAACDPVLDPAADQPCGDALPPLVSKAFRRLHRRVGSLAPESPGDEWHSTRICAKKARYATEAVAPILGRRMHDLADSLSSVTDILGNHQDAHVAQAVLRELAGSASGERAFALGLLYEHEVTAAREDQSSFLALWPSVHKAARRARVT